jgi:ADP-ribose pyrophosphatase YjhB (NUDIX family)
MRARVHLSMLRLYQRLPRWGRRRLVRTMAPSYTVGAMCFIDRGDGELLLVRHAYRDRWGVPGGLLQRREEPDDGARREVLEETGLAIELLGEPVVVVDPGPQRVDVIYRARPAEGGDTDAVRPGSPEIVETRWFRQDALPELQHETVAALIALARHDAATAPRPPLDTGP